MCGHHYHSAHASVVGTALCKEVYHGQYVCGGLAGAGLGAGNEVVAVEDDVDSLFLNRSALLEVHGIEGVKYVVAEVQFVKSHVRVLADYMRAPPRIIVMF